MEDDNNQKPPKSETVLQLEDGQVGETETDELETQPTEPKHVTFELPSTSWQSSLERQKLDEARALVQDLIENILRTNENEEQESLDTTPFLPQPLCFDDEKLQRILQLLDRYARNLETIEEHMLSSRRALDADQPDAQLDLSTELQLTQHCELATQTLPLGGSIRMDITSSIRPKSSRTYTQLQQQQQQQQQPQQQLDINIPPCERRHHTITISSNGSSAFTAPVQRRTFLGRIWQTLGDFCAAFCLCLQVNKDCVFCLGFFLAFVISASFLTAFFYRTISLTNTPVRVPIDPVYTSIPSNDMATVRLNGGGYYYIYNSQRQHFL